MTGAVLLVLFTLLGLVSGLVTGKVWDPSFLVFALAMLLLFVGQVTVGIASRRLPGLGPLLIVAGACVLVAVVVPVDPWHDIGLVSLSRAGSVWGCDSNGQPQCCQSSPTSRIGSGGHNRFGATAQLRGRRRSSCMPPSTASPMPVVEPERGLAR